MLKSVKNVALRGLIVAAGGIMCAPLAAYAVDGGPAPAAKVKTTKPAPAASTTGKEAPKASTKAPATQTTKAATKPATKAGAAAGTAALAADDKDVALTPPPAGSSPLLELKKSNEQLDKLLKKKYPTWSPEGEAQKAAVQKLVGGFLDYRELAHRALARHWDKLTSTQRQEFVKTLRQLVERSYLKQVSGDPNYNIKYEKETVTGSEGTVDATLNTVTRGKKVKIALVYKVVYKDRWLVYDVVTDEQSMLENYRAEFNKIINRDGFDALLNRMKKKLEEKDE